LHDVARLFWDFNFIVLFSRSVRALNLYDFVVFAVCYVPISEYCRLRRTIVATRIGAGAQRAAPGDSLLSGRLSVNSKRLLFLFWLGLEVYWIILCSCYANSPDLVRVMMAFDLFRVALPLYILG